MHEVGREKLCGNRREVEGERKKGGFNKNTLYACLKFSKKEFCLIQLKNTIQ